MWGWGNSRCHSSSGAESTAKAAELDVHKAHKNRLAPKRVLSAKFKLFRRSNRPSPSSLLELHNAHFSQPKNQAKFTLLRRPFSPARWSSTDRWAHSDWRVLRRIRMIKTGC